MINCNKTNLKKGDSGTLVKEVQNYMKYIGLYTYNIDGKYEDETVKSVKKLQKRYNLVQDGKFGTITCKNSGINGQDISNSIQVLKKDVFKDMVNRHDQFVKNNGREPQICWTSLVNKYRYITISKYNEMKKRFDEFTQKHNREPNYTYINIPKESTNSATGMTETQAFINKFSDAVGKNITSFRQGYNAIKYRKYIGYNNDIYDRETALYRLKYKKGLNCSDISQLLYKLAQCFGHNVHYIHLKCRSGIGHIILSVDGTWVDGASALSSGHAYGTGWCYNGRVINKDDKWLMTDDGRT